MCILQTSGQLTPRLPCGGQATANWMRESWGFKHSQFGFLCVQPLSRRGKQRRAETSSSRFASYGVFVTDPAVCMYTCECFCYGNSTVLSNCGNGNIKGRIMGRLEQLYYTLLHSTHTFENSPANLHSMNKSNFSLLRAISRNLHITQFVLSVRAHLLLYVYY